MTENLKNSELLSIRQQANLARQDAQEELRTAALSAVQSALEKFFGNEILARVQAYKVVLDPFSEMDVVQFIWIKLDGLWLVFDVKSERVPSYFKLANSSEFIYSLCDLSRILARSRLSKWVNEYLRLNGNGFSLFLIGFCLICSVILLFDFGWNPKSTEWKSLPVLPFISIFMWSLMKFSYQFILKFTTFEFKGTPFLLKATVDQTETSNPQFPSHVELHFPLSP